MHYEAITHHPRSKIGGVPETIVLLHGFGGTHRTWDSVTAALDRERNLPLALDLPGHGSAATHLPITFERCVDLVL
ncbi:MAG: alpha/beta fold hydrolase, partial [Solirubrobacteraceae bacterium]